MSKASVGFGKQALPYLSTTARARPCCVSARAQRGDINRREAGLALGVAALSLIESPPVYAIFGIGEDPNKIYTEQTSDLLATVRNVVSLERDDPKREEDVAKVRTLINDWVARYRRDNAFAGRPSYSNAYSVVNALAGHFNSFGTETPLPKKRLERLLKVTDNLLLDHLSGMYRRLTMPRDFLDADVD